MARTFAPLDRFGRVLVAFALLTVASVTVAQAQSNQATSIQLPDASLCQFSGTGAAPVVNGQRVNYTCGVTVNNGTTVILGNPVVQSGVWTVTEAVTEPGNNGPQLRSSQTVTMTLSQVQLVDNTQCTPTTGTVPIVENQRLNYTCGRAQEGLLGDFNTTSPLWTTVKVVVAQQPPGRAPCRRRARPPDLPRTGRRASGRRKSVARAVER